MQPRSEIPEDPALAGIGAIRNGRLAGAVLGRLCGYSAGSRATFDAWLDGRRVAVKVYARDPAPEAALYAALAAAGAAGDCGPRVPPLIAWNRELRVLVIGWLEGCTAGELLQEGRGARAGELAAQWLQCAFSLQLGLGPELGAAPVLERMAEWVAALAAADAALGRDAAVLAGTLARAQPKEGRRCLVHGTFYDRHVLDTGDGPGVIDWQRYGRGPPELDAAMFLATLARLALRNPAMAGAMAQAEGAFLAATDGLFDGRALAWHRAAALLHLARRRLYRRAPAESRVLVEEAGRHAATL